MKISHLHSHSTKEQETKQLPGRHCKEGFTSSDRVAPAFRCFSFFFLLAPTLFQILDMAPRHLELKPPKTCYFDE